MYSTAINKSAKQLEKRRKVQNTFYNGFCFSVGERYYNWIDRFERVTRGIQFIVAIRENEKKN